MFITCSTQCFGSKRLEEVFATMIELQFQKYELVLDENSNHLKPSEVHENLSKAIGLLKSTPGLIPTVFTAYFGELDSSAYKLHFLAVCRLARQCFVPVINIQASSPTANINGEILRLKELVKIAEKEGVLINLIMEQGTLASDPKSVVQICKEVKQLGVCLDPSLEVLSPDIQLEELYSYARHIHFRDTGRGISQFQVRVGQGQVDFGKVISHLEKCKYERALSIDIQQKPEITFPVEPEIRKLKYLLESMN